MSLSSASAGGASKPVGTSERLPATAIPSTSAAEAANSTPASTTSSGSLTSQLISLAGDGKWNVSKVLRVTLLLLLLAFLTGNLTFALRCTSTSQDVGFNQSGTQTAMLCRAQVTLGNLTLSGTPGGLNGQ